MALVVQKFGGTSVANIKRIKNVAKRAAKTYDQGNDVVIILSAMAGVTDGLVEMANRASKSPDKREMDVLLATGEQTTAALLAMILKDMGYTSQSMLGHQAEVVTDCDYGNARIIEIGAGRLWPCWNEKPLWWSPVSRDMTLKVISRPSGEVAQILQR